MKYLTTEFSLFNRRNRKKDLAIINDHEQLGRKRSVRDAIVCSLRFAYFVRNLPLPNDLFASCASLFACFRICLDDEP